MTPQSRPSGGPDGPAGSGGSGGSGEEPRRWVLWRQDDHGNKAELARYTDRADAQARATEFEARGHKQLYWVAPDV